MIEPKTPLEARQPTADPALIISADGHAIAPMEEYKTYIPSRYHQDFDDFYRVYCEHGLVHLRTSDPVALARRADPEVVDQWYEDVFKVGRHLGNESLDIRLRELDRQGIAAEVLFPDFGLPFEIRGTPDGIKKIGYAASPEHLAIANQAHNRWLVDFISPCPERFAGLALVCLDDVDAASTEIRWAKDAGLSGVLLPHFDDLEPIFHPKFEPIWHLLEDLCMPIASHGGNSSITRHPVVLPNLPHPAVWYPLSLAQGLFYTHQLLAHLIWGGVLERHPKLQFVMTEQGSGWVVGELEGMDYSYEGSYLRRDIRGVIRLKPSEYFARQCYLGSSLFSRAEIVARHAIGVDKMALGMDYPHHEGTWAAGPGTVSYLRATLGAVGVPVDEARQLLGETAATLWRFDVSALAQTVDRIGPSLREVLTPPPNDEFPRGDVNKPLGYGFL
jgi:predicted TIM-barrel fold metal-dependent hydrolase